jgi:hypothetical protein
MTLSDLGAIGEFVSSIAVVVTLVYLAIQIRHSRELLERQERLGLGQAYQAKTNSRIELEKLVIELAETSVRVQNGEYDQLTDVDKFKIRQLHSLWADWWDNNIYQASLGFRSAESFNVTIETVEMIFKRWEVTGVKPSPRVREWFLRKKREGGI